jgi:drug/metabolite transporter (DMT)-like permease
MPTSRTHWRLILAFAAVYLIWGSTYLAIQFAIGSIPPFLMAGSRFLISGSILFIIMKALGTPTPTRLQWRTAAIVGIALLALGNGGVTWAEQFVPSGLTALIMAITPLWMVLLEWLRPAGNAPGRPVMLGVGIGFVGIMLLVWPRLVAGSTEPLNPIGILGLLVATLSWAAGSIYSRTAPQTESPLMMTAMQMLIGGGALALVSLLTGDYRLFDPAQVTSTSFMAWLYLVVVGGFIGFTAYTYMIRHASPARVSTYAYVNPVVAVFLGWLLADETVSPLMLLAAAIILLSVFIINTYRTRPRTP